MGKMGKNNLDMETKEEDPARLDSVRQTKRIIFIVHPIEPETDSFQPTGYELGSRELDTDIATSLSPQGRTASQERVMLGVPPKMIKCA